MVLWFVLYGMWELLWIIKSQFCTQCLNPREEVFWVNKAELLFKSTSGVLTHLIKEQKPTAVWPQRTICLNLKAPLTTFDTFAVCVSSGTVDTSNWGFCIASAFTDRLLKVTSVFHTGPFHSPVNSADLPWTYMLNVTFSSLFQLPRFSLYMERAATTFKYDATQNMWHKATILFQGS